MNEQLNINHKNQEIITTVFSRASHPFVFQSTNRHRNTKEMYYRYTWLEETRP